jgi:hypothetical protein
MRYVSVNEDWNGAEKPLFVQLISQVIVMQHDGELSYSFLSGLYRPI